MSLPVSRVQIPGAAAWASALLALVSPIAPACRPDTPPPAAEITAPSATDAASPASDTSVGAAPASAPPSRRPAPPPRPATRAEPLVEHSGELAGPVAWIVAETASAQANAPIIALLHGRGDDPERFVALAYRLAAHLDTPVRFVVARAPLPFGLGQGRQWFDAAEGSPEAVLGRRLDDMRDFLGRVAKTWPEAPRPVLVGFSQGGMMALHTAVAEPARVAGAASLSGGFAVDLGAAPAASERPPILVATGDRDGVVPPERTRAAADWLASHGFSVERVEFRGAHRITDDVIKATGAWLTRIITAP